MIHQRAGRCETVIVKRQGELDGLSTPVQHSPRVVRVDRFALARPQSGNWRRLLTCASHARPRRRSLAGRRLSRRLNTKKLEQRKNKLRAYILCSPHCDTFYARRVGGLLGSTSQDSGNNAIALSIRHAGQSVNNNNNNNNNKNNKTKTKATTTKRKTTTTKKNKKNTAHYRKVNVGRIGDRKNRSEVPSHQHFPTSFFPKT